MLYGALARPSLEEDLRAFRGASGDVQGEGLRLLERTVEVRFRGCLAGVCSIETPYRRCYVDDDYGPGLHQGDAGRTACEL